VAVRLRVYQKATDRGAAPDHLPPPQRSYDHLANWEIELE